MSQITTTLLLTKSTITILKYKTNNANDKGTNIAVRCDIPDRKKIYGANDFYLPKHRFPRPPPHIHNPWLHPE